MQRLILPALAVWMPSIAALLVALLVAGCGKAEQAAEERAPGDTGEVPEELDLSQPKTAEGILAQRQKLDQTLWKNEVEAQRHEKVITGMWDRLRAADDPFEVLGDTPLEKLARVRRIEGGGGSEGLREGLVGGDQSPRMSRRKPAARARWRSAARVS